MEKNFGYLSALMIGICAFLIMSSHGAHNWRFSFSLVEFWDAGDWHDHLAYLFAAIGSVFWILSRWLFWKRT